MRRPWTTRKRDILATIDRFWIEHGYRASYKEIATVLGVSIASVREHLDTLERAGLVSRELGRGRTLMVTEAGQKWLQEITIV